MPTVISSTPRWRRPPILRSKDPKDRLVEATPQEAQSGKPILKLLPAIKYKIDALLIFVPLFGMMYFLFYPTAFNAFLVWLVRIL